jgi:RNA polymerase sigma-70 factor (ECF subfamily)
VLDDALRMRRGGTYQVQAAIAACHDTAPDVASTDWPQIAALYDELLRLTPSPVVELNRAVAVAMAEGIPVGLALVDGLAESGRLEKYHLLYATRADLLRRDGRIEEAGQAYEEALRLAPTEAERRYLTRRIDEL